MAGSSISKTAVWILLALLILGLGGFGITNLSGGVSPVGSVGDEDIAIDDYARALQQEINAIEAQTGSPLAFAEAQALLALLGALDHQHRITKHGRVLAGLPLHPRLAHMLCIAGPDVDNLCIRRQEFVAFSRPYVVINLHVDAGLFALAREELHHSGLDRF